MSLAKLIQPESVAIVGVSEKPGKFGHAAAVNLSKSSISQVYYVHPQRETVFDQPCYPTLSDLPTKVDCAVICTPAHTIRKILHECGQLNIPAAIVFASGFSEERSPESMALEDELVEIATHYGIQLLGPNCLGAYNAADDIYLWGMDSPNIPTRDHTGIGVAAQSGWIVETFIDTEYTNLAYGLSTGNGNLITLEDCLSFMVDQDAVRVIALYLEGIKKPAVFLDALKKAAEIRKPVVILKGGRSELGAASAASHTGNLAGSRDAFDAIFKKYGVIAVEDFDQLLTISHTLSVLNGDLPTQPGYGGIALSGGENTLFADLGMECGLHLPAFTPATKAQLRKHIPKFATPHNPMDATTHLFFNDEAILGVLQAVDADPEIGATFLSVNIELDHTPIWGHFCKAVARAKQSCTKPVFAIPASEGSRNKNLRRILEDAGIPIMGSPGTSLKCLKYLADFITYSPKDHTLVPAPPRPSQAVGKPIALTEGAAKQRLSGYGIPVPRFRIVQNPVDIKSAIQEMEFPLALKASSTEILHKTDLGAVRLNLQTEGEVLQAYHEVMNAVRTAVPGSEITAAHLEEIAPTGLEMIVGLINDPHLGPMILVGLGGVLVEVFQDKALYPAPINKDEAIEMLKELKAFKLLNGYRGSAPYDIEALVDMLVKVSDFAMDHRGTLKELDLNPVFVYQQGSGIMTVDALLIEYSPTPEM